VSTLAELALDARLRANHWRILVYLGAVAGDSDLAALGLSDITLRQAAEHLCHRGLCEQVAGVFRWRLSAAGRAMFPAAPPAQPGPGPQPAPAVLPAQPAAAPKPAPQAAPKPHPFTLRPKESRMAALRQWAKTGLRVDLCHLALRNTMHGENTPGTIEALDFAERFAAGWQAANEESARQP